MKRILPIAFLFLLGCVYSYSQAPVQIDPAIAAQHLLDHPKPIYPAIARAARVMGTVVVLVVIDENGRVADESVVSGPPMLQSATLEGIRQFMFSPFTQDGKPVEAITAVGIGFATNGGPSRGDVFVLKDLKMDEGMKKRGDFLASYSTCNRQVQQSPPNPNAIKSCQDAVRKAETPPSGAPARRSAYVAYATALLQTGKTAEAIQAGNSAIAASNSIPNNVLGASAAYAVTAEALALAGNLQQADAYFSSAEKYARKAIGFTQPHSQLREQRSQTLKALLEYHAKILDKMGNRKEAEKKQKGAAKL